MPGFDSSTYGQKAELMGAAPFRDQTSRRTAPAGRHKARLVGYEIVQDVKREYQGQTRTQDEAHVLFELMGTTDRTFVATYGMRLSWRANAKLYQFFEQTFGPDPFPNGFDTEWFQNIPCEIDVEVKTSGGGSQYAICRSMRSDLHYSEIHSGKWRDNPESRIDPVLNSPTSPWPNGTVAPAAAPAAPAPDLNREIAAAMLALPSAELDKAKALREFLGDDAAFLEALKAMPEVEEVKPPAEEEEEEKPPARKRGRPKGSKNKPKPEPEEEPTIPEDEI